MVVVVVVVVVVMMAQSASSRRTSTIQPIQRAPARAAHAVGQGHLRLMVPSGLSHPCDIGREEPPVSESWLWDKSRSLPTLPRAACVRREPCPHDGGLGIHNIASVMYPLVMAMRRFQILLDEELDYALERQAELESVSKAELLRRYARERLEPPPPVREDPLWELVGVDDADDDPGGRVDIDEVVYGGNR